MLTKVLHVARSKLWCCPPKGCKCASERAIVKLLKLEPILVLLELDELPVDSNPKKNN